MLGEGLRAPDEQKREREHGDGVENVDPLHGSIYRGPMHTRLGLSRIRAVERPSKAVGRPSKAVDEAPPDSWVEVRFWLPPPIAEWIERNAGRAYKTRSAFLRDYFVAMYRAKGGKL